MFAWLLSIDICPSIDIHPSCPHIWLGLAHNQLRIRFVHLFISINNVHVHFCSLSPIFCLITDIYPSIDIHPSCPHASFATIHSSHAASKHIASHVRLKTKTDVQLQSSNVKRPKSKSNVCILCIAMKFAIEILVLGLNPRTAIDGNSGRIAGDATALDFDHHNFGSDLDDLGLETGACTCYFYFTNAISDFCVL